MTLKKDTVSALLFLVFSVAYGYFAWQIPTLPIEARDAATSSTLPKIYASLGVVLSLLAIAASLLEKTADSRGKTSPTWAAAGRTLALLIIMSLYALAMDPLGFLLATELFLLAGYWVMGERRPKVLLLASLPVVAGFWLIMTKLLGIYLVPGSLWS